MPNQFDFSCPLKIHCGRGAISHLPAELTAVNANAPLVLAPGGRQAKKRLAAVVDAFRESGMVLGVYDRLPNQPEPDLTPMLEYMYRDGGCDSIVVVGGGSAVNAAKCLNLYVSAQEHAHSKAIGANGADPGPLRPLMLVATAGGDGDEATGYADDDGQRLASSRLVPAGAFIDPVMMNPGTDEQATVDGALIALVHAVEAFLDERAGPLSRAYAHTAIGLILNYLPAAVGENGQPEDRCAVVNGQVVAGCAFFASSPGVCHALASALKPETEQPRGYLMAMLLPHLLAEAANVRPERIADLLLPMTGTDRFALTAPYLKPWRAIALLWELIDGLNTQLELKIPITWADAGITEKQLRDTQARLNRSALSDLVTNLLDNAAKGPMAMSH